ncbi:MAG: YwmB family TATA-box binding protein [Sporolactobacillus sp.]
MSIKKLLLFIVIAVAVFSLFADGTATAESAHDPLAYVQQFSKALEKNQARVLNWSIYARKSDAQVHSIQDWKQAARQLKAKNDHFLWSALPSKSGVYAWQGTQGMGDGMSATLTDFAYDATKGIESTLTLRITGLSYDAQLWPRQKARIRHYLQIIFGGHEEIFSCVKAVSGVRMKSGLADQGENYLKIFSAAPIERMKEKTFISLSAYTKACSAGIETGNQKMNLQVALRREGGHTLITLGTPIITQEY